jgi:hypothetical protein
VSDVIHRFTYVIWTLKSNKPIPIDKPFLKFYVSTNVSTGI